MASLREAGWEAFKEGKTDEAQALLTQACRENPSDYDAHLFLGAVCGRAGRHQEAISALTVAVHLQPANAQARYNLGVAMEQAGYPEQAAEAFRQAVTLDPNYFKARDALHRLQQGAAPEDPIMTAAGPSEAQARSFSYDSRAAVGPSLSFLLLLFSVWMPFNQTKRIRRN